MVRLKFHVPKIADPVFPVSIPIWYGLNFLLNSKLCCGKSVSIPIWYGLNDSVYNAAFALVKFQFQYGTA